MSFYRTWDYYADPDPTIWVCLCQDCGEEWESPIEAEFDPELGRMSFPRPCFCPVCDSTNLLVEQE